MVLRVGLFLLSFVDNLRMFSTTSFGLGILNPALGALLVWDDELPETRRNEAAANLLTLASRRDPLNDTSWSIKGLKLYPIGLPLRIWRQGRGSFLQDIKCVLYCTVQYKTNFQLDLHATNLESDIKQS